MDEWHQNPKIFHHDQDMVQWTERLRPCAKALYIVLFENYKDLLSPVVVSILNEAMNGSPPLETEISHAMLLKDAAYTAVGHVYYELSNFLNFSDWFQGSLSIELSNKHPNMCIIHRKIAFILGQWASEKLKGKKTDYAKKQHRLQSPNVQSLAMRSSSVLRSLWLLYCYCKRALHDHQAIKSMLEYDVFGGKFEASVCLQDIIQDHISDD